MRHSLSTCLYLALGIALSSTSLHASTVTEQEIDHLLRFIAASDCQFIRNGSTYPAREARAHIERKYHYLQTRLKTTEAFIRDAASQSSFTGKPYRVDCAGKQTLSQDWLLDELQRYRQASDIAQRHTP